MSTLQSRTFVGHTSQSLQKSVPLPTQVEYQNIFSSPSKKIKTLVSQTNPTKTQKLNNDNGLQTRWTRTTVGNNGFTSCGVRWLNSSAVFQFNFIAELTVLRPEIPHERKAAKR